MILFGRHAVSPKNQHGGTDTPLTPLVEPDGLVQARAMGRSLHIYFARQGISQVDIVTSGYVRTDRTAELAMEEIARLSHGGGRKPVEIASWTKDERIREIKWKPREFPATRENPGYFGRQPENETRDEILGRLHDFKSDRLSGPTRRGHATLVIGHRGATQILYENALRPGQSLHKMHNAEILRVDCSPYEFVHYGVKADRDAEDPKRIAARTRSQGMAVPLTRGGRTASLTPPPRFTC